MIRVGINGFGRIGRSVFRILGDRPEFEVVAINDLYDNDQLAYLLKYDTVMRVLEKDVTADSDSITVGGRRVKMTEERDPARIPWGELGVDVVVESTGVLLTRAELEKHLAAGAKKVVLTVPPKGDIDAMVVLGVNDETLGPQHRLVSNASCTTNCLAPLAKILDERFGIEEAFVTTVHAYTNDQRLADVPHKDLRRSRAAAENIIPTTTGAARAVGKVYPKLAGRLDGIAMRVPVPDGSIVDVACRLSRAANGGRDQRGRPRGGGRSAFPDRRIQRGAARLLRRHREPAFVRLRLAFDERLRGRLGAGRVVVRQRVGLLEPGRGSGGEAGEHRVMEAGPASSSHFLSGAKRLRRSATRSCAAGDPWITRSTFLSSRGAVARRPARYGSSFAKTTSISPPDSRKRSASRMPRTMNEAAMSQYVVIIRYETFSGAPMAAAIA